VPDAAGEYREAFSGVEDSGGISEKTADLSGSGEFSLTLR
jgi:hypothetical protein